mmetsp:Transcript_24427/g.64248  ORF Transcript_24427/g.64248 Transcript_24427/m.64248 type:complete len:250 (-) Transcript_24427:2383-3132(-)
MLVREERKAPKLKAESGGGEQKNSEGNVWREPLGSLQTFQCMSDDPGNWRQAPTWRVVVGRARHMHLLGGLGYLPRDVPDGLQVQLGGARELLHFQEDRVPRLHLQFELLEFRALRQEFAPCRIHNLGGGFDLRGDGLLALRRLLALPFLAASLIRIVLSVIHARHRDVGLGRVTWKSKWSSLKAVPWWAQGPHDCVPVKVTLQRLHVQARQKLRQSIILQPCGILINLSVETLLARAKTLSLWCKGIE